MGVCHERGGSGVPQEEDGAEGTDPGSMGAFPYPRSTSANELDGGERTEAGDLPSDEDGLKSSQSGSSSPAPLEIPSNREKTTAARLRVEKGVWMWRMGRRWKQWRHPPKT
jgi:hypothetical protein